MLAYSIGTPIKVFTTILNKKYGYYDMLDWCHLTMSNQQVTTARFYFVFLRITLITVSFPSFLS